MEGGLATTKSLGAGVWDTLILVRVQVFKSQLCFPELEPKGRSSWSSRLHALALSSSGCYRYLRVDQQMGDLSLSDKKKKLKRNGRMLAYLKMCQ